MDCHALRLAWTASCGADHFVAEADGLALSQGKSTPWVQRCLTAISPQCANVVFKFISATKIRTRLTWSAHELPAALMSASLDRGELHSVILPKAVEISLSDHQGRHVIAKGNSAKEVILSFLRSARFPCVLAVAGYPDVILRHKFSSSQRAATPVGRAIAKPRSRKQARLLDALKRGCVSRYSTCAIGV